MVQMLHVDDIWLDAFKYFRKALINEWFPIFLAVSRVVDDMKCNTRVGRVRFSAKPIVGYKWIFFSSEDLHIVPLR